MVLDLYLVQLVSPAFAVDRVCQSARIKIANTSQQRKINGKLFEVFSTHILIQLNAKLSCNRGDEGLL
jgi:hypothetical protein